MNNYFSIPFTLLITTSGMGISLGNWINSNKSKNYETLLKSPKVHKISKIQKEKEKELIKEDKLKDNSKVIKKKEDFVWEFVFFHETGKIICGAGDGQWTRWGEKKKDCSTEWMKKYVGGDEKTSHRLWLKFKNKWDWDGSWARQFLMTIWGIKVLGIKTTVDWRSYWRECSYWPDQINNEGKSEGWLVGCHKVNNLQ